MKVVDVNCALDNASWINAAKRRGRAARQLDAARALVWRFDAIQEESAMYLRGGHGEGGEGGEGGSAPGDENSGSHLSIKESKALQRERRQLQRRQDVAESRYALAQARLDRCETAQKQRASVGEVYARARASERARERGIG